MRSRVIGFIFGCVLASLALITVTAQVSSFPPRGSASNTWTALQTFSAVSMPMPKPLIDETTVFADSGTLSAGTYYFRLVAIDPAGRFSPPSDEVSVTIAAPRDGLDAMMVTWDAHAGSTGYRLYIGDTSGGQDRYLTDGGALGVLFEADDDPTAGTIPAASAALIGLPDDVLGFYVGALRLWATQIGITDVTATLQFNTADGDLIIRGMASSTVAGGDMDFIGGASTAAGAAGGSLTIGGGDNPNGDGGTVNISGGNADDEGGNVTISAGTGTVPGQVQVSAGSNYLQMRDGTEASIVLALPTVNPCQLNQLWNDAGTLKVSDGCP